MASIIKETSSLEVLRNISIWTGVIGCWVSLFPWIVWTSTKIYLLIIYLFVFLRIPFIRKQIKYSQLVSISVLILFSFCYGQFFIVHINEAIYQLVKIFPPLIILLLFNKNEKELFLKRLVSIFSGILLFSILFYFFHFFIDLPYVLTNHPNQAYSPFKNYLFFVIESDRDLGWFSRFQSVYTEPGHLAMICAIFLNIIGYTWKKWQNIVMTIGIIWSFSLGGFVLYFVGLILNIILKAKNISFTLLKIGFVCTIIIILGISFYSPTNNDMFSILILSRLELDESNGISGNNRNTPVFEFYYNQYIESDKRFLGIGSEENVRKFASTGNSSYKNFVVERGIWGMFMILFLMGMLLYCYPSRKGLGLMILLIISFVQRPYFLWPIECMPYIAALGVFYKNCKNEKVHKLLLIQE